MIEPAVAGSDSSWSMMQLLVKRKGCSISEYGLVDMGKVKRQRLQGCDDAGDSPVSLQMLEDWERFQKSAKMAVFNNSEDGQLDLGE